MSASHPVHPPELNRRLVFSLLRPAAQLARRLRMPLKTLEELCRLAYFEQMRRSGETAQADVARMMDKSLRTIGSLEKQYRGEFLAPETEVEFSRRVEAAFDGGPTTLDAVVEHLGLPRPQVEQAVAALMLAGRITRLDDGTLAQDRRFVSLVRGDMKARVDGLNHQLDIVTAAVSSLFLEPKQPAVARALSFVATDEGLDALGAKLIQCFREHCIEAEEQALKQGGFKSVGATFALAPLPQDSKTK